MNKTLAAIVLIVLSVWGGVSFAQMGYANNKWICNKCGQTAAQPWQGPCGYNGGSHHWVRND
jgi:hypothetical protein